MLRLLLTLPLLVALCRYTVRDVAFVDLGDTSYRLELRVHTPDPATLGAVATSLLDTNVTYEVNELDSFISDSSKVTLHHPDGRILDIDLWSADAFDAVKLSRVIDSPLRRRLLDEVFTHYAFVLLVEGKDEEKNARAHEVIEGAFKELGKIYDQMPKAVGERPRLTTLPHARRGEERVLLFGLGIEETGREPTFAVLMGRGRRVGPVLVDEEISPTAVFGILQAVGQSCECDLDRSWMQGPRVPLRWNAETKARVVQDLSFDAENPFVRTEISGILARGPQNKQRDSGVTLEEALMAYEEIVIPTPDLTDASATPEDPQATTPAQPYEQEGPPWGAIALVLVIGGLVIPNLMNILAIKRRRSK